MKLWSGNQPLPKPKFQVFVSSLLYLPRTINGIQIHWNTYFREEHYKQLGTHLFVSFWGDLHMIVTYMDETQPSVKEGYKADHVGKLKAVYPVIRNDFESNRVKSDFCLGLYFDDSTPINRGDRLYHRDGDYRLIADNVKDLQMLYQNHPELLLPTTKPFAAFYVGAGAKLVVMDNYGPKAVPSLRVNDQKHHNRSLIQQGGIVIFKGQLMVSLPILSHVSDENKHDGIHLELMTWKDFCEKGLDASDPNNSQKPSLMTQPVICLGAQDSKYNSIAWKLSVEKLSSGDRRIVLQVPFGARFISIGQGQNGMTELNARITYSMLHDSVVTHHDTQFRLPHEGGNESIANILNINDCRSYIVKQYKHILENKALPKEFHFSTITPQLSNIGQFIKEQAFPLAVPPMYPAVCCVDQQNHQQNCHSLPSVYFPEKDVDLCYHQDGSDTKIHLSNRDYTYRIALRDPQRQWKRVANEDPENIILKSGQQRSYREQKYYRLGVDGWMYETLPIQEWLYENCCYIYPKL